MEVLKPSEIGRYMGVKSSPNDNRDAHQAFSRSENL